MFWFRPLHWRQSVLRHVRVVPDALSWCGSHPPPLAVPFTNHASRSAPAVIDGVRTAQRLDEPLPYRRLPGWAGGARHSRLASIGLVRLEWPQARLLMHCWAWLCLVWPLPLVTATYLLLSQDTLSRYMRWMKTYLLVAIPSMHTKKCTIDVAVSSMVSSIPSAIFLQNFTMVSSSHRTASY